MAKFMGEPATCSTHNHPQAPSVDLHHLPDAARSQRS